MKKGLVICAAIVTIVAGIVVYFPKLWSKTTAFQAVITFSSFFCFDSSSAKQQ